MPPGLPLPIVLDSSTLRLVPRSIVAMFPEDFVVALEVHPYVQIRGTLADLAEVRDAIQRAIDTGASETTREVLGGTFIKVAREG